MLRNLITYTSIFFSILTLSATSAFSGSDEWKAKMIADALTAAPPIVQRMQPYMPGTRIDR